MGDGGRPVPSRDRGRGHAAVLLDADDLSGGLAHERCPALGPDHPVVLWRFGHAGALLLAELYGFHPLLLTRWLEHGTVPASSALGCVPASPEASEVTRDRRDRGVRAAGLRRVCRRLKRTACLAWVSKTCYERYLIPAPMDSLVKKTNRVADQNRCGQRVTANSFRCLR